MRRLRAAVRAFLRPGFEPAAATTGPDDELRDLATRRVSVENREDPLFRLPIFPSSHDDAVFIMNHLDRRRFLEVRIGDQLMMIDRQTGDRYRLTILLDVIEFMDEIEGRVGIPTNFDGADKAIIYFAEFGQTLDQARQMNFRRYRAAEAERAAWQVRALEAESIIAGAQEKLSGLKENYDRLAARALSQEEELIAARSALAARGASAATKDPKFERAKKAFARHFHPNSGDHTGLEATLRAEVFKEFWSELEKIEAGSR